MTSSRLPPLVEPFRAERFTATGKLSALIAPPYDVIVPERRAALAERDTHNIVHLILPQGTGAARYSHAAALLERWRADGSLARDAAPSVYVVRQEFETPDGHKHVRTGVVAALHVEPYDTGRVKPHERTHRGPKEDRLALSRSTCAVLESIFVLARDTRGHLQRRLEGVTRHEPTALATLDGVRIGLWKVGGVQAAEIARAAGEGALYMADGHHRFETANAYRAENPAATRIPALVVPIADPGLVVLPSHRMISGATLDPAPLLESWRADFQVDPLAAGVDPDAALQTDHRGPACVVAFSGQPMQVLSSRSAADGRLEIEVIEDTVVRPLMEAAGDAARVSYSADAAQVIAAVEAGEIASGVLVGPTPVEQVLAVSDAQAIMPPKSTYFAPKVPSGLVLMPYDT